MIEEKGSTQIAWNRGLTKENDERVAKISNSLKGRHPTEKTLHKLRLSHLGQSRQHKKSTKEKIRLSLVGHSVPEDVRKKIRLSLLGTHSPKKGKKLEQILGKDRSIITRNKMRESRLHRIYPIKDTSIEVALQNELTKNNIDFRKHVAILNVCQADIFIEPHLCIFVDGCYWHGCKRCFNKKRMSEWIKKRKVADVSITKKLQDEGYTVLRFWGHDIDANVSDVLDKIISTRECL